MKYLISVALNARFSANFCAHGKKVGTLTKQVGLTKRQVLESCTEMMFDPNAELIFHLNCFSSVNIVATER